MCGKCVSLSLSFCVSNVLYGALKISPAVIVTHINCNISFGLKFGNLLNLMHVQFQTVGDNLGQQKNQAIHFLRW